MSIMKTKTSRQLLEDIAEKANKSGLTDIITAKDIDRHLEITEPNLRKLARVLKGVCD